MNGKGRQSYSSHSSKKKIQNPVKQLFDSLHWLPIDIIRVVKLQLYLYVTFAKPP